ncbi:HprK-related kinase A [Alteromonas sp. D210916BOD_24]|uniref:HprK-related kinase A n=1 Tax=Alteromonas sp. D210916BOD_24 TaxID=3157618 RepID=UPI00399CFC40
MQSEFVLNCAPYTFAVTCQKAELADRLVAMYDERLVPAHQFEGYIDYRVAMQEGNGLRHFIKPQSRFVFEGNEPFLPFKPSQGYALFEWGLNWVVSSQEFNYLIVHSAVLAKGDKAILFPASSGSGKSTLAAYLMHQGWRLLSDEMALIKPFTREIVPFVKPLCLKNESITLSRQWYPDNAFSDIAYNTHKGNVIHIKPTQLSVEQQRESAKVVGVIFPRYTASEQFDVYSIDKVGCFKGLTDNAFNYGVLGKGGVHALINIAENSQCFELHYDNLQDVAQFLEEVINDNSP